MAQSLTNQYQFGNSAVDYKILNSVNDKNGNLICLTNDGTPVVKILKFDINNKLLFTKQIGGNTYFTANGLTVDDSNNIWIAGTHRDRADLDPDSTVRFFDSYKDVAMSKWNDAIFILKLTPNANFIWAKSIDDNKFKGYFTSVIRQIKIGTKGSIFIQGSLGNKADFDLDPSSTKLYGGSETFFVAKYSKQLKLDYVFETGSNSFQSNSFFDVDSFENGYFGTGGGDKFLNVNVNTYLKDVIIYKINPTGSSQLLNIIGSKNIDCIDGLSVLNNNQVVFGGRFMDTLIHYVNNKRVLSLPPQIAKDTLNGRYTDDIFLCSIDSLGNFLFSKNIGNNYLDYIQDIKAIKSKIYVTGRSDTIAVNPYVLPNKIGSRMFLSVFDLKGHRIFQHLDAFPISSLYPNQISKTSATVFEHQVTSRNFHLFNDTTWKVVGTIYPSGQTYYDANYVHSYYPSDTSIIYKISKSNQCLIQSYNISRPKLNIPKDTIFGCKGGIKVIALNKLRNGDFYEFCTDTSKNILRSYSPNSLSFVIDNNPTLFIRSSNIINHTKFEKMNVKSYSKQNNVFSTSPYNEKGICAYNFTVLDIRNTKFKYYWHYLDALPNDSIKNADTVVLYFFKNKDYLISLSSVDVDGNCYNKMSKNIRVNCASLNNNTELSVSHKNIDVFPNPSNGKIHLLGVEKGTEYQLLSSQSQLLFKGIYDDAIELTKFIPGVYFVMCNGEVIKLILTD
jgi:hypothetical protein